MIEKSQVYELIEAYENELKHNTTNQGIFEGYAGLVLFYFEKLRHQSTEEVKSNFDHYLQKCLFSLNNSKSFTLCSGDLGVYYVILYLISNNCIDEKIETYFEDFPEYGKDLVDHFYKDANFDYLHGILGVLALYIELFDSTKENSFKSKIKDCIIYTVELILKLSVEISSDQISWLTRSPSGKLYGHTFGLAHGIPSILSVFARIYSLGILRERIEIVLKRTYNFIISIKGNYGSASFPNFIVIDENGNKTATESSRLAWCYGDIGVGISILNYAIAINCKKTYIEANSILIKTTLRNYESSGIEDTFLCHGTSGLFFIYNYLFKKTKILDYYNKSIYWLEETIRLSSTETPGRKTWLGSEGWIHEDSILEGKAGLVLALYSFLDKDYKNPLEKLFLISNGD